MLCSFKVWVFLSSPSVRPCITPSTGLRGCDWACEHYSITNLVYFSLINFQVVLLPIFGQGSPPSCLCPFLAGCGSCWGVNKSDFFSHSLSLAGPSFAPGDFSQLPFGNILGGERGFQPLFTQPAFCVDRPVNQHGDLVL